MVAERDRFGGMRRVLLMLGALGLAAAIVGPPGCSGKSDAGAPGQSAGEAKPAEHTAPKICPPGNAIKDRACVAVVTLQKIAVVAQQQTRLDDLARLLDQVDTAGAPIELFGGIRQLEPWKALKASSEKFAGQDAVAEALDQAVKTLRAFKGSLGEASARLGNLKGDLDRVMADTGTARRIEEVRAQISPELRAAIEPFAAQVQDAIQHAIVPLTAKLSDLSGVVLTGCVMTRLSGGEKMKDLCTQARDAFGKAVAYMGDLEGQPAKLFDEVTSELEAELDLLVDAETKKLLDAARARVDEALRLPPASAGSGSAAGPGSGSGK